MEIKFILDWKSKTITNNGGFESVVIKELKDINKVAHTVYCSAIDWAWIKIDEKYPAEAESINIGETILKPLARGGDKDNPDGWGTQALKKCWELCPNFTEEHPSHDKENFDKIAGWVFPPRFENLKQGSFEQVWKIDIKSCYGEIMRSYPLPYDNPTHLKDPHLIEQKLKEKIDGFVCFYLKKGATIKKEQIPFIPDYHNDIKSKIAGRLLLHTKLFRTFKKQYKKIGKIIYNDLWIFPHRRGDVDPFLDYCDQLSQNEATKKQSKMLRNSFYGAVGKSKFGGYNYRAWTLAINHLAILQTYYLYRQFRPEQVLAIRSDCIYVQGELPLTILKDREKYHLEHYQRVSFSGEANVFIHDTQELKSFTSGEERAELLKSFKQ